jgi:hypothetical protein
MISSRFVIKSHDLPVGCGSNRGSALFIPHPNLGDEINRHIVQSEIEGGVFLEDLSPSTVLHIETKHHCYTTVVLEGSQVLISGHPTYCPQPIKVNIAGSTWGGSMLKLRFIGRGMHLEFSHPEYRTPIVTSPIQDIRECLNGTQASEWAGFLSAEEAKTKLAH